MRSPLALLAALAGLGLGLGLAACGGGGERSSTSFLPRSPAPLPCTPAVRAPQLGSWSDLRVEDLGEHPVNELVSFSVTTGTTSLTIVSQEVAGSAVDWVSLPGVPQPLLNTVVPDALKTPGGSVYFDDLVPLASSVAPVVYWGESPVVGTFTGPNTSYGLSALRTAAQLAPGTWTFLANDWANECAKGACTASANTGRYHLWSVTKQAPLAATGTLDLEVYLLTDPTSAISTAAAAATSPRLARWASSLSQLLGKAGVSIGTLSFHDLPGSVHQQHPNGTVDITDTGPCGPLAQLFAASSAPGRGVNLFLVDELVEPGAAGGTTFTAGIDGTIPGPSGFPGTIASGAAVGLFNELDVPAAWPGACSGGAISLAGCGPDRLAYVAAHEIGHWLGLYHVTEASGASFDPLSDTLECHASCAGPGGPGAAGLLVTQCVAGGSCGGGDNLMFWLVDPNGSTGNLSRDQGQVVRLNPAVR